eukprot:jgi/Tetstr1/424423/TSEL_001444.t1
MHAPHSENCTAAAASRELRENYGKISCPHTKKGAVVGAASKSAAKPLQAVGKKPPIKHANKSTITHLQEQLDASRIKMNGRNVQLNQGDEPRAGTISVVKRAS